MNGIKQPPPSRRNKNHPAMDAVLKAAEAGLLAPGQGIILGFSGGPDSTALYHILIHSGLGLTVTPVHINHLLRGTESDEDQEFCKNVAKGYGSELLVYSIDVAAVAKKRGVTIEEAGRDCRYSAFFETQAQTGADGIAIAHNRDDNAETLILRFFRGTGLKGLAGIPKRRGNIVRPLLEVSRADILDYCEANGLAYRKDSSNECVDYKRNWVRNVLTPLVTKELNPDMVHGLSAMIRGFQEDETFLSKLAADAFSECYIRNSENFVTLDTVKLSKLDPAILGRVVRLAYGKLTGSVQDLSRRHTEDIMTLARNERGKWVCLPEGVRAVKGAGILNFIYADAIALTEGFKYETNFKDDVNIKELGLTATFGPVQKDLKKLYTIRVGYDKISDIAVIRNRLPGDIIQLAGVGRKSLKTFVNGLKLEPAEKSELFVLAEDGEVVAVMTRLRHVRTSERYYAADMSDALIMTIWEGNAH